MIIDEVKYISKKRFRLILTLWMSMFVLSANAQRHLVRNAGELRSAVEQAGPGHMIVLANGEWKDAELVVRGRGDAGNPVVIAGETPGMVLITGRSTLKIGGEYLVIKDLYFKNGTASDKEVVSFRIDSRTLANHCRVTGLVIDNFNPEDKTKNDNWVALYGKHNRVDHCTFINKSNLGPTLVVKLDDERSRDNLHRIDSNYFKGRLPLGVNGGETIRIGVSDHSMSSSRTSVVANYFERCNGEAEIISVKSGDNRLASNTFFECEGNLVLRHGNNNIVESNLFLGNGKPFTGGVRVINSGHHVFNNVFKDLAGDGFRSSMGVMNGVYRSPLNRYHQVKDVDIHHNTFINCKNVEFGLGKNDELTLPPEKVRFRNNLIIANHDGFYKNNNPGKGITFSDNMVIDGVMSNLPVGFKRLKQAVEVKGSYDLPVPTERSGANLEDIPEVDAGNTGAWWYGMSDRRTGKVGTFGLEFSLLRDTPIPVLGWALPQARARISFGSNIANDALVVCTLVKRPSEVRYAGADNPELSDLYNKKRLWAAPFRSGEGTRGSTLLKRNDDDL